MSTVTDYPTLPPNAPYDCQIFTYKGVLLAHSTAENLTFCLNRKVKQWKLAGLRVSHYQDGVKRLYTLRTILNRQFTQGAKVRPLEAPTDSDLFEYGNTSLCYDRYTGKCWKFSNHSYSWVIVTAGTGTVGYTIVDAQTSPRELHRILATRYHNIGNKLDKNTVVDHIKSANGTNSQDILENLRLSTVTQNRRNAKPQVKNQSGFKGVSLRKGRDFNPYGAWITVNRKAINLGCFNSAIEAATAYDNAALQYFGEYALTNKALGLL